MASNNNKSYNTNHITASTCLLWSDTPGCSVSLHLVSKLTQQTLSFHQPPALLNLQWCWFFSSNYCPGWKSVQFKVLYNTGYTQKNGAVSKVNKKFISHLTRAQRTPSVAAIVQVSHALPAVRISCLLRGRGASFQDGVTAEKGFLCAQFWGVHICDYSAACTV